MPKIFKIGNLTYTPFDKNFIKEDYNYLHKAGLEFTPAKGEADIFVASDIRNLRRFMVKNPFLKNFLLWTNEPRFSKTTRNFCRPLPFLKKVYILNIYNGKVFTNNVTYQKKRFEKGQSLELLNRESKVHNRTLIALMSYYQGGRDSDLVINGVNVDLIRKRSEIALFGFKKNLIDIYGRGWPEGISKEDSRGGNWVDRKREILNPYNFNLAFENTVAAKYITEKIWDSIENYCLPVYYGGLTSTVYEIFPEESFIDYSKIENPADLYNLIQNMTHEEFRLRMNRCIQVYNNFLEKPSSFWEDNKKMMLDNIISTVKEVLGESK